MLMDNQYEAEIHTIRFVQMSRRDAVNWLWETLDTIVGNPRCIIFRCDIHETQRELRNLVDIISFVDEVYTSGLYCDGSSVPWVTAIEVPL